MRKYIIASALIIISVLRAYDVQKMIDSLDPEASYPNATALNIYTEVTYDINDDYSYEHKVFYLKKILDYSGKIRYSDVEIEYNPDYETVELIDYYSLSPEKVKIPVPENQVYDLNTDYAVWSPEYIHNRKKIINFPQVEPGYYIVLEYRIKNTRKLPPNGVEHFQESNPYLEKALYINYPKNLTIKYDAHPSINFTKKEDSRNRLRWKIKNSPLIKEEPSSPSYLYSGKPVLFSFYKDWKEFNEKMFKNIYDFEKTPEVTQLAKEITKDLKTDAEKIDAVYDHLAKNYQEKTSYTSQIGFTPEKLSETITRKFGSSRDLTALFIALAEASGVKNCEPALLLSNDFKLIKNKLDEIVLFDAIEDLAVFANGKILEPGERMKYAGFRSTTNDLVITPSAIKPFINKAEKSPWHLKKQTYKIEGKNLLISVDTEFSGGGDFWMREFERYPESERALRFFQWYIRDNTAELLEGPVFTNFGRYDKSMSVSYKIKKPSALTVQGDFSYFPLPGGSMTDVSLKSRENDLYLSGNSYTVDEFVVDIGKDYDIISPENREMKFKNGKDEAYIKISVTRTGDKAFITRESYLPEMLIPKDKYPGFREFIMTMSKPVDSMLFLKNNVLR
ncbi:MAG TPA: DUF3857 and transglutaminase domain-containing protein [Clostridiales bacterium]|nr:DUF3857 and transglutaminase domain-containing protein [Clostridiales bacterium]HQP70179.1 DUF3857 and transglutaminase domain-containing protein [Clostridiales bacterium]